jgi:nucleoside-diphosphate kinase
MKTQRVRTFALIKPFTNAGRMFTGRLSSIIGIIEHRGLVIEEMKQVRLTPEEVDVFYQEHVDKFFYQDMKAYMLSGPVVPMILSIEGVPAMPDAAVVYWRHHLGATDSAKAANGTLRELYGNKDGLMYQNVAHGSDSLDAYARESALFFGTPPKVRDLTTSIDRLWEVERNTDVKRSATDLALAWFAVLEAKRAIDGVTMSPPSVVRP